MAKPGSGGRRPSKRERKNIPHGVAHIKSSFNNTIVTVTDQAGNTIAWSSAGVKGFKGSRKSTPFAAGLVAEDAVRKAMEHGLKAAAIFVKGPGSGRESALRAVANCGVRSTQIGEVTPIAHNGCRPPKKRRV